MASKADASESNGLPHSEVATIDRRLTERNERRHRLERRGREVPVALDRRKNNERRGGDRRRQVDPTTCERDYDADEIEFMKAIEDYKKSFARPFPTWTEVLEICKSLGYRKVAERTTIIQNRAKAQRLAESQS